MPGYRVLDAQAMGRLHDPTREFALEVLAGLSERPKRLSSKYFYDDEGSRYFQQIMALDEYYLTNCEREILETHRPEILEAVCHGPFNLVDLGAGDGAKTMLLIQYLLDVGADFHYVPIDISEGAMKSLVAVVRARFPNVPIEGLVSDYTDGLHYLGVNARDRKNLVLFLGSNIGNFDRARARAFLRRMWSDLKSGDRLLIGFDLKKDIELLLDAYNDSQGITTAFNLNLLTRINRELHADFDVSKFRHFGTYDVFSGAMHSYLVSLAQQTVYIDALQLTFEFKPWEPIFTEYSYKYLESDIAALSADAGFVVERQFFDHRHWFVDSLWRAEKRVARTD